MNAPSNCSKGKKKSTVEDGYVMMDVPCPGPGCGFTLQGKTWSLKSQSVTKVSLTFDVCQPSNCNVLRHINIPIMIRFFNLCPSSLGFGE